MLMYYSNYYVCFVFSGIIWNILKPKGFKGFSKTKIFYIYIVTKAIVSNGFGG